MIPDYWERACCELVQTDAATAALIARFPDSRLGTRGTPFETLLRAIVGQQISTRAADAIWARLATTAGTLSPQAIIHAGADALRGAGLSSRKAEYVLELAAQVSSGQLNHETLAEMDDQTLTQTLTRLRGIGRWTAEMFLIFNLNRPDVWPIDDIGLKKALVTHGWAPSLDLPRKEWEALGDQWRPWRTVMTWFLWRSQDATEILY